MTRAGADSVFHLAGSAITLTLDGIWSIDDLRQDRAVHRHRALEDLRGLLVPDGRALLLLGEVIAENLRLPGDEPRRRRLRQAR